MTPPRRTEGVRAAGPETRARRWRQVPWLLAAVGALALIAAGGPGPPTATPMPTLTPTPTPRLVIGVGGHDNWPAGTYRRYPAERVFALLRQNGYATYRVDVATDAGSYETLSRLVALGRRYGIVIRPMLYVDTVTAEDVYRIVKAFSADIDLWEFGNELNLRGADRFAESIGRMRVARRGLERAAAETGRPLRSAINVTAFAGTSNKGLDAGRTTYPFLDRAVAMGLPFDVISYHYYPDGHDRATGWMRAYLDPLRRYGKPVLVTEANCAQINTGDDGNSDACAATLFGYLEEIAANYADLISEVILYELFDDPLVSPEAERHFGVLFDIDRPKKTFSAARLFGRPAEEGADGDRPAGRAR